MKRVLFLIAALLIALMSQTAVKAEDNLLDYDTSGLFENLPEQAEKSLENFGITSPDLETLNNLSLGDFYNEIIRISSESVKTPLEVLAVLIAVLILCSVFYSLKGYSKSPVMQSVLSLCGALCITLSLSAPIISLIDSSIGVIKTFSAFMLSYIPITAFLMSASGGAVSASSYYGLNCLLSESVSFAAAAFFSPLLKALLALSVTSSITSAVNLRGVVRLISRFSRWSLALVMTAFSVFLSVKQVIGCALDSASVKAARLGLSSAVPIVGGALSEAYRTVLSSVNVLKSGVGVTALIAAAAAFLPSVLSCVFWIAALSAGRTAGEILGLGEPSELMESVSNVVSSLLALLLSVMSVFIVSSAAVMLIGGAK